MTWAKMVELGTWQDAKTGTMSPLPSNRLSKTDQETCGKETLTLHSQWAADRTAFLFTPNPFYRVLGDEVKESQEQAPTDLQSFA